MFISTVRTLYHLFRRAPSSEDGFREGAPRSAGCASAGRVLEHPRGSVASVLGVLLAALALCTGAAPAQAQSVTVNGVITDARQDLPLIGVNVVQEGTTNGAVTNAEGRYELTVPSGPVTLVVSFVGYKPKTVEVNGDPGDTITRDFVLSEDLVGMDEVVVVGSRSEERTVLESPVPIDVISSDDMEMAGTVETAQMLQKMIPSLDFPRQAMGDGTETVRPIRFRGLGPDQVLVLVNGKRRHQAAIETGGSSAGVDLNAIPAQAIKRVEVLRDGASAQYGTDAVAGVINVVLKDDVNTSFALKGGLYGEGDGETANATLQHGLQIGDTGFLNLTGQLRYRALVNRAGPDGNQQWWGTTTEETAPGVDNGYGDANPNDGVDTTYYAPDEDHLNALWEEDPQVTFRMGDPEKIDGGVFFNGEVPIENTDTRAYTFGGLTRRHSRSGCYFRRPNQSARYNPMYPNGFLPLYSNFTTDASAALGVKGTDAGWNWDVSSTYGGNFFERNLEDSHNASMQEFSPTEFMVGTKTSQQIVNNLDVTRGVDAGLANPLNISFGSEVRMENYQIGAGQRESYIDGGQAIPEGPNAGGQPSVGSQCFPGFTPGDEVNTWRQNVGGYLDLSADITESLFLTSAIRFENYSDFGSTLTGKVAGRFEFYPGYAVRAAFNTGFRAPALLQTNFSSTQTGFEDLDGDGVQEGIEIRTFPIGSQGADALGAPELEPETSRNFSAGVTLKPASQLSLTVDFYDIRVDDRIRTTSTFFRAQNELVDALFSEFPELDDVAAGTFFTNALDTRSYGFDVVARYGIDLGSAGQARLTSSFNWLRNEIRGINETPGELSALNETLCDEQCQMAFERELPRTNLSVMLNYRYKGFGLMVTGWRPGEVLDPEVDDIDGDGAEERLSLDGYNRVPPTLLLDAEISYRFQQGLTLGVGGNNILDKRPPRTRDVQFNGTTYNSSFNGNFPYVNMFNNSYGISGGFYYVRANYTF